METRWVVLGLSPDSQAVSETRVKASVKELGMEMCSEPGRREC